MFCSSPKGGESLNIQCMKDACPTSKQFSAQKRKNNLTFCQSFSAVFKLKYLAICNIISMTLDFKEINQNFLTASLWWFFGGGRTRGSRNKMDKKICILHSSFALEKEKRGRSICIILNQISLIPVSFYHSVTESVCGKIQADSPLATASAYQKTGCSVQLPARENNSKQVRPVFLKMLRSSNPTVPSVCPAP